MSYLGSDAPINWLQCLFWLSILQWVLTAGFLIKDRKKLLIEIPNHPNPVPFIKDTFYIYWNLYPIIFYLLFHGIESSLPYTLTSLDMISHQQASQDYALFFKQDIFGILPWQYVDYIIIFLSIVLAYFGSFYVQSKKQELYRTTGLKTYWWDKELNKAIYNIRLIFLFINLIFIAFMVYLLTRLALFITVFISHNDLISISPFHPDHYGGLSPLIDIASTIMLIYLFRVAMGIKGLLDHREVKGNMQKLGDIYHVAHLPLAIVFLLYFLYQTNALLDAVNLIHLLRPEIFQTLIPPVSSAINIHEISTSAGYLRALQEFNSTPIIIKIFSGTLFATFSSFVIWFFNRELASFFKTRKQA